MNKILIALVFCICTMTLASSSLLKDDSENLHRFLKGASSGFKVSAALKSNLCNKEFIKYINNYIYRTISEEGFAN